MLPQGQAEAQSHLIFTWRSSAQWYDTPCLLQHSQTIHFLRGQSQACCSPLTHLLQAALHPAHGPYGYEQPQAVCRDTCKTLLLQSTPPLCKPLPGTQVQLSWSHVELKRFKRLQLPCKEQHTPVVCTTSDELSSLSAPYPPQQAAEPAETQLPKRVRANHELTFKPAFEKQKAGVLTRFVLGS